MVDVAVKSLSIKMFKWMFLNIKAMEHMGMAIASNLHV
jgi:hypothetical protein